MRVERGHWTLSDRAEAIYRYVPFEVPVGTRAISVRLRYDRTRAVIDLGLFDPDGFRGWSGSSKEGFVVTPERATPGYLPGPLVPGEWCVLLGLHRLPAEGIAFELEIDLGRGETALVGRAPPRPERPPRRRLPATDGRRWLAGDLHAHTVHSDGTLTPVALACLARSRGLDFLAVTDHNTTSHHAELAAAANHAGILLVPGLELTTDGGHANCLGSSSWIDFRRGADEWLDEAEAAGALLSVNHPLAGDMSWRLPMDRRPPLVEVWHSSWDRRGLEPLEWWREWGAGHPVGGSDFHGHGADGLPGTPTTWLEAEGEDVLGALLSGRIAVSADPSAPLVVRQEDDLLVLDADGATLLGPRGERRRITSGRERLPAGPGPYRLVGSDGMTLALAP